VKDLLHSERTSAGGGEASESISYNRVNYCRDSQHFCRSLDREITFRNLLFLSVADSMNQDISENW
jgi:hypothetical protein